MRKAIFDWDRQKSFLVMKVPRHFSLVLLQSFLRDRLNYLRGQVKLKV